MPEHIKALIVIFFLAIIVFYFARKVFEPMLQLQPGEFVRWRNTWLSITVVAFLAGNFWLYIVVSAALIIRATKPTENRFALYLILLFVVPPISLRVLGTFNIDYIRLLSLTILLPMAMSSKWRKDTPPLGRPLADKLLILFITLKVLLLLRGLTVTDTLRYGVYAYLDWFLPYYVASRVITNFKQLKTAMGAFVLACLVAGVLGAFEYSRTWILYHPLAWVMNVNWEMSAYVGRGEDIRASSSLAHPLILGYVMMIAIGFFLFLAPAIKSKVMRLGLFLGLAAGLFSPLSRGPWIGAAILVLIFIASGPKIAKRFSVLLITLALTALVLPSIPGGTKIINLLPFIGNTGEYNVDYRERLFDRAVIIVGRNPFFGVSNVREEPEMQDMVQGEGIIDIINTYISVAFDTGLIGLGLFLALFILALSRLRKSMKRLKNKGSDEYLCGRSLFATMIAILVTLSTLSAIAAVPTVYYILTGLIFSYVRIVNDLTKKEQNYLK